MSVLPDSWAPRDVERRGDVLIGFSGVFIHVVAPPGIRLRFDEPDSEWVRWRHAEWEPRDEEAPVITVDVPDRITLLSTWEVVAMLPADHHDFVRRAMARQISRAVMFGGPLESGYRAEEHAQKAGRALSWVTAELSDAFPGEHWFTTPALSMSIPGTIDELLKHLPTPAMPEEESDGPMLGIWVDQLLGERGWSARATLGTDRRMQSLTSRTLMLLLAVRILRRLPGGERRGDRLFERATRHSEVLERAR